jgi:hypothetical protein
MYHQIELHACFHEQIVSVYPSMIGAGGGVHAIWPRLIIDIVTFVRCSFFKYNVSEDDRDCIHK